MKLFKPFKSSFID